MDGRMAHGTQATGRCDSPTGHLKGCMGEPHEATVVIACRITFSNLCHAACSPDVAKVLLKTLEDAAGLASKVGRRIVFFCRGLFSWGQVSCEWSWSST